MTYFGNSHYWNGQEFATASLPLVECRDDVLQERLIPWDGIQLFHQKLTEEFPQNLHHILSDSMDELTKFSPSGQRCPWKMLDAALENFRILFQGSLIFYLRKDYLEAFYSGVSLLEKLCHLDDFLFKKYGLLVLADRTFDIIVNSYLFSAPIHKDLWQFLQNKINQNTMIYYNYSLIQILICYTNCDIDHFSAVFRCTQSLESTSCRDEDGQVDMTEEYFLVLEEFHEKFSSGEDISGMITFLEKHYCYVDLLEAVFRVLIRQEKNAQAEGIILTLLKDFQYQRNRVYLFKCLKEIKTKTGHHQNWIVFPDLYQDGTQSLKGFAQFLQIQGCFQVDFPYFSEKYHWYQNKCDYYQLLMDVKEFRVLFDSVKDKDDLYLYAKILVAYFPEELYQRYAILLEKSAKQARVPFEFEMVCRRLANLIDLKGVKIAKHMIHLFRINYKGHDDFMNSLCRLEEKCF